MAETIHRLFSGVESFDPSSPLHANAERLAGMAEQSMLAQPAAKQRDAQGRQFVTTETYGSLSADKQKQVWTLSPDQVTQFAVGAIQSATREQVQKKTDELESYFKARSGASAPEPTPKSAVTPAKPKSPSSVSAPKVTPTPVNDPNSGGSAKERAIDEFING
jgi:hypothetical protein